MNLKEIFKPKDSRYGAKVIMKWLWRAWRGNRLQAIINASLGLLSVVVSLSQVWAVKHAIDVACHTVEGDVIAAGAADYLACVHRHLLHLNDTVVMYL